MQTYDIYQLFSYHYDITAELSTMTCHKQRVVTAERLYIFKYKILKYDILIQILLYKKKMIKNSYIIWDRCVSRPKVRYEW